MGEFVLVLGLVRIDPNYHNSMAMLSIEDLKGHKAPRDIDSIWTCSV